MEKLLLFIFTRPILTSFVVGSLIHLSVSFNYSILGHGMMSGYPTYWQHLWAQFSKNAIFSSINFLIPYLVPFLVSTAGRKVTAIRTRQIMHLFPEMNPDMVLHFSKKGEMLYQNPTARKILADGENRQSFLALVKQSISEINLHDTVKQVSWQSGDHYYDLSIRISPLVEQVFVSAKDVTQIKQLQQKVLHTAKLLNKMSEFLDKTMESYDPLKFDLGQYRKHLVSVLLTSRDKEYSPSHIFMAESNNGCLCGHLYYKAEKDVEIIDLSICIDESQQYAITLGKEEVFWSNWQDSGLSLEAYQQQFHPDIQKRVGCIEHFATYQSGKTVIIAFYPKQQLDKIDGSLIKDTAIFSQALKTISDESKETENAFIYMINSLAVASEVNDEDTGSHIVRINEYARLIAQQLGMDEDFVREIHYAAQMHDVGKIHVDPHILKKPGKLTDEEFAQMQQHPAMGAKILGDSPRLQMAREIAQNHHEKYNGKGYPEGLRGEQIPISARIVALVDVYDALRQKRVYKPAFSHQKAFEIITKGDGRTSPDEFDPDVLQAFIAVNEQMDQIFNDFQ